MIRMKLLLIILALTSIITGEEREEGEDQSKTARNLSVFNVVSFPNTVCAAKRKVVNVERSTSKKQSRIFSFLFLNDVNLLFYLFESVSQSVSHTFYFHPCHNNVIIHNDVSKN